MKRASMGGVALIGALLVSGPAMSEAQGVYPPHMAQQAYAMPAAGGQPMMQQPYSFEGDYMNAHGEQIGYNCGDCGSECGCYPGRQPRQFGGGGCGCSGCGGGCGCGGGYGLLSCLSGGCMGANQQCGPHYFDFSLEYLYYQRDEDPLTSDTIISTFGFANTVGAPPELGPIPDNSVALRGSDVSSDEAHGYRITGRVDVGALSFAEFAYSGVFFDDEGVAVERSANVTDRLFSIFSLYGTATNGDFGVAAPGAPTGTDFEETDNATLHRLDYEADLQTAEATFRRYWVGYSPRVSGTLLAGFRYTSLEEELGFFSQSDDGSISIDSDTDNRLAGFQFGGDAWVCLFPGMRVGGEIKAGVYNNSYVMASSTLASDGSPSSSSRTEGDQVAFLTEAKVTAVANITPSLSVRAGYEVLFMNELANSGDNLLNSMPYGDINNISANSPAGVPASTDAEALFHGAHAGLEYTW